MLHTYFNKIMKSEYMSELVSLNNERNTHSSTFLNKMRKHAKIFKCRIYHINPQRATELSYKCKLDSIATDMPISNIAGKCLNSCYEIYPIEVPKQSYCHFINMFENLSKIYIKYVLCNYSL